MLLKHLTAFPKYPLTKNLESKAFHMQAIHKAYVKNKSDINNNKTVMYIRV